MDKEYLVGTMVTNMTENGTTIKKRDSVFIQEQMEMFIEESGMKIELKVKEFLNGQMEALMKEIG